MYGKKNGRNHGRRQVSIQLKHGGWTELEVSYRLPGKDSKKQRRGRKRKVGKRGKKGVGYYPALRHLGVLAAASPALGEDVTLGCLANTFAEAVATAARGGVDISEKRIRRISHNLNQTALRLRERRVEVCKPPRPDQSPWAGKRIAVLLDGGRIQIRTNRSGRRTASGTRCYDAAWREPKLYVIYEFDENGRKVKKAPSCCDGTIGGPDDIVRLLVADLKRHGAGQAARVVFLGDGALWIWNRIEQIAADAGIPSGKVSKYLDFYHAAEHLGQVADAMVFSSQKKRSKWFRHMKTLLKTVTPQQFLAELSKSRRRGNATIRREYQYFAKNQAAIDYRKAIKLHIPIGSGAVESAIRRVVNLRLKGAGMFWLKENAEGFLHLRCQLKSNNWNKFYEMVLEEYAAGY